MEGIGDFIEREREIEREGRSSVNCKAHDERALLAPRRVN